MNEDRHDPDGTALPAEAIAAALTRLSPGSRFRDAPPELLAQRRLEHRRGWPDHGRRGGRGGPALMRLVTTLAAAEAPLSVSDIGEEIGVDQPRASRLVAQAVEHGLARREADPSDARRTRIALTEEGRALAERFLGARRARVEQALDSFTESEQRHLAELLTKLANAWPR